MQDVATKGVAKKGVVMGCEFTVEVIGPQIKFTVQAASEQLDDMKKTYDALNTVEGMMWLIKKLGSS